MLRNVCVILMDLQLDRKLALVTASTGGIGKEIGISLAREGATVIINSRTPDGVADAAADIREQPGGADKRHLRHGQYHYARLNQNRRCRQAGPGPFFQRGSRRSRTPLHAGKPAHVTDLIEPREIADFVTFVSSPLVSAINGAALRIDGGLVRSVF
jgi:NAD(P)-dependent dehydrogenase (short-subunit alcohol dehydrogenase family)